MDRAEDVAPFADLPASMVQDVLAKAESAGEFLLAEFRRDHEERDARRMELEAAGLVLIAAEFPYVSPPTTCGIDGSYAIERLLSADLAAAAAVAVEGLTPPSETRHWAEPHHASFLEVESHHAETSTILRAVMLGRELMLATQAPHDLVLLDMTLTLPIIYFNQALNLAPRAPELRCSQEFLDRCEEYLEAYRTILDAKRSDKQYVGLPKYSTRREIGRKLNWPHTRDDRSILTHLLRAGELTRPFVLEQPAQPWHLGLDQLRGEARERLTRLANDVVEGLSRVHAFYYKPHPWLPALRVEVAPDVAGNDHRLATILQGLQAQCATPAIMEPYPQYLADRMAKALARAMPAFRQIATQTVSESYDGDAGEVFFAMHGYRTESGR